MTVGEALQLARDRIANGWIQGRSHREVPEGWCSTGALSGTHGGPCATCGGCLAEDLLSRIIGDDDVPHWNDHPGRTQAEVLAAFDKAIALAESAS